MQRRPDDMDPGLRELIDASAAMHPDEVVACVRDVVQAVGGTGLELLVADLSQQTLAPLPPHQHGTTRAVATTPAGAAYRRTETVTEVDGESSRLWVPMIDSAERVGILGVTVPGRDVDPSPWESLAALVAELVVAKSRYGDNLSLARRTQPTSLAAEMRWALLPPLTFGSGHITVTGILEPAYDIAGDTFDYAVNGNMVHLAIFDAMGHGLEASRMANVAVMSYRHSRYHGRSLTETAQAMDEAVQECFDSSRYVTGQLATLDLDTRSFRMLNMGHPLPLLIRRGSVVGELPSVPKMPAGWGDRTAHIYETTLQLGDMVLMYTDGITEARHPDGRLYGDDRFTALLNSLLLEQNPPEEVLRRVIQDIMEFQEHRPHDDATLVLAGLPEQPRP